MLKHTTAALAALTLGLGAASAQDMGAVKIGVHAGGNFIVHNDASSQVVDIEDDSVSTVGRDLDFDGGFAVGATAGIAVTESLMLEAEYTFRNNEFAEGTTDDDFNTSAFMANALLPMEVDPQTTGYIGLGAGYIMKHDSDRSVPVIDEVDGAFAYQVKAGFDYDMGGNRTLGFGVTYLAAEFGENDDEEVNLEFGSVMGVVSLKFGG